MLDIETPLGQETLDHERRSIELWARNYPNLYYCETPKDRPASVDGILTTRDDRIVAVVEQKSRDTTLRQLAAWDCEWLVTQSKIDKGRDLAMHLCVPFLGFLYLIPDDALVVRRIANENGSWAATIRTEATRTRATVNGGSIIRENAYIDMTGASVLRDVQTVTYLGKEAA
jgi:hypothetical protein